MRIRYFPIRSLTAFDGSAEKATWRSTEYGGLLVQMYGSAEGTFLLQVYLDDLFTPVLTVPVDINALIAPQNEEVYVGLTAANGVFSSRVQVSDWNFMSTPAADASGSGGGEDFFDSYSSAAPAKSPHDLFTLPEVEADAGIEKQ